MPGVFVISYSVIACITIACNIVYLRPIDPNVVYDN